MMNRREFLKLFGKGALVVGTAASGLTTISCSPPEEPSNFDYNKIDPEVKEYATQYFESIMPILEENIGLQHLGMPNFELKGCGHRGDHEFYNPDTDTVTIYVPRSYVFFSKITTEELIRHGLGHFYADKLSENLGNGSWPPRTGDTLEQIRDRLLTEGVAEYFRRKSSRDEEDTFKDSQWPKTLDECLGIEDWNYNFFYNGGYHLVKPLIDAHGQRGIEYLIVHSPEKRNLTDLQSYQEEALASIR